MQAEKVIEMLGYSTKEAKVYLAMLSLGECHISDIAIRAEIPRTSAQAIVDKLHKDGLANFYVMRRYKYWVAENPRHLLDMMRQRQQIIEEEIPYLVNLRDERKGKRYNKNPEGLPAYRVLADAIKQPILVTNDKVQIEYVNGAWEEQFGYTFREVKGKNPRIFQSGKTPHEVYAKGWGDLRSGKMFQTDKVIDRRKDGTDFKITMTVFPMTSNGKLYYVQILDPQS